MAKAIGWKIVRLRSGQSRRLLAAYNDAILELQSCTQEVLTVEWVIYVTHEEKNLLEITFCSKISKKFMKKHHKIQVWWLWKIIYWQIKSEWFIKSKITNVNHVARVSKQKFHYSCIFQKYMKLTLKYNWKHVHENT